MSDKEVTISSLWTEYIIIELLVKKKVSYEHCNWRILLNEVKIFVL